MPQTDVVRWGGSSETGGEGQGECERRIEVFEKIHKNIFFFFFFFFLGRGGGVQVGGGGGGGGGQGGLKFL